MAGTPAGTEEVANPSGTLDLAELVVKHHRELYRYAFRLAGCEAEAEDLTQQTFLVAHERLWQVREPEKVRAWLYRVLRSCYLHRQRRRRPVAAADLEFDVDTIPQDEDSLDFDSERLQAALNELPDEFKIVILLFYFDECSYKEIAAELNIPLGTVMSRLARAKGHLRTRLLQAEAADEHPNS